MEPNEYELMTNEQLATGLLSEIDVNEAMCEEAARRLRTITALQSQIDGMIKRPVIGTIYRDSVYCITINGIECDMDDTPTTHYEGEELKARYRRALGMDEAKEGGSDG